MDPKVIIGIIAVILAALSFIPYIINIFKNKTKPHTFSWLVWSVLMAIGFAGQVSGNAGAGSWAIGVGSILCFSIFLASLFKGEKNIVLADWLSLLGAGISLIFWYVTNNALISIILITLIDMFGFFPTFRKAYYKPFEETSMTFFIAGLSDILVLFALENYSIITWLYPASLIITNILFVSMVGARRKSLRPKTINTN
jgi:hypothetical protein